jgi:hypothetical protein
MQRPHSRNISRDDRHHLSRNLKAEFNEVDILPKTRDAAIMATTMNIAANAPNDNNHMAKLRALALKGVRVLQMARTDEPAHDPAPRQHTSTHNNNGTN